MIALDVFLHNRLVGHLHSDDNDRFSFVYDPAYLERKDAIPLSCSLPLQSAIFPYPKARPFFAGVLPEESSREIVADRLSIARSNDIKLACAIGGDCAGAVCLLPTGQKPLPCREGLPSVRNAGIRWLAEDEFADILRRLLARYLLAPGDGVRLSLAGAMCKLTLCHQDGRFGIPDENTPSTHIIKL